MSLWGSGGCSDWLGGEMVHTGLGFLGRLLGAPAASSQRDAHSKCG